MIYLMGIKILKNILGGDVVNPDPSPETYMNRKKNKYSAVTTSTVTAP